MTKLRYCAELYKHGRHFDTKTVHVVESYLNFVRQRHYQTSTMLILQADGLCCSFVFVHWLSVVSAQLWIAVLYHSNPNRQNDDISGGVE